MIATGVVNITINGRQIHARAGQSVLQAAAAAGIDIPALCYHPACRPKAPAASAWWKSKSAHAATRLHVSDFRRSGRPDRDGTRRRRADLCAADDFLRTAALLHVLPGQRQRQQHRLRIAEAGLSLRLDLLGARAQLSEALACGRQWQVLCHGPQPLHPLPAVRPGMPRDFRQPHAGRTPARAQTRICADDDQPLGLSTCVSCGSCLQVCPTGALMDRRSSFLGHETDVQRIKTTCPGCAVGCGIECLTRDSILSAHRG